jgi:trans-aconitate 2-methyltransferase
MPTWDASQYLRFDAERTRPCRDLVDRINLNHPQSIIDLGCGPGNSTAILSTRWPAAQFIGLDRSAEMIAAASASPIGSKVRWRVEDVSAWAKRDEIFDLVFSNAAFQWLPDHAWLFPRLMAHVAPGGALAMQVPMNIDAPAHALMRDLAKSPKWVRKFPQNGVREWHVHPLSFYYDLLAPLASAMDIWTTEYIHILPGPEEIVEWYKGTGLRPYLDALPAGSDQAAFLDDYLQLIRQAFCRYADGRVLFPFQRLFLIAYRPSD